MFNLNELEVFVKAAETNNFSVAARSLHMSQPAVSLQIRSLERRLRTALFHREGRVVTLTEAGQILAPLARDLLLRARRVEEIIASMQGEVAGELSVACSTTSGKYLLPHLIAAFRDRHPQVVAKIIVTDHVSALKLLLDGLVHLAVSSTPVDHLDLEYHPFITDRIVLIVPKGHPWADQGSVRPIALLEERLLLREASSGTRKALFDGLSQHGIRLENLNIAMELGNAEAIEMAVEAGLGIAFVSVLAAAKGIELGRVCVVDVEGMDLVRPIVLAKNRKHAATRAQNAFHDFVFSSENQEFLKRLLGVPTSV